MDSKEAWETPIRHFCESVADPTSPEYWSAFSSLGITLFALLCLFTGHHSNALVKFCAAVLAWCGIGSFGFHWTLSEAWSFLDTFPMTCAAVLGMYLSWIVILDECGALLLGEGHGWQGTQAERPAAAASALLHLRRSQIMSALALVAAGLLIWSLVLNVVYGNVAYDSLFTGLGLVLIGSALGIRACHRHRRQRALLQRRWAITTTAARCNCGRQPLEGRGSISSDAAVLLHRAPVTAAMAAATGFQTTTTTRSELVAVEHGTVLNDDGEEKGDGERTGHHDGLAAGIALGSSRSSSSSSSGDGDGSADWPPIPSGSEKAAPAIQGEVAGTGDDSLAAALLPHGRGRRRCRSRQRGQGEEAWVVEVRVKEGAYMTFLGGETQALSVVLLGLVLVAVAAVVWETSERLCPDPRFHWLRYLRLHSIWHLAIGYGVFLLLQASAVLSAPGLYGRIALFDNRHFARYPALNTLLPRVVYGAPVPTAAHATCITYTSYSLPAQPKAAGAAAKESQPCESCGQARGRERIWSASSAATASTASACSSSDASVGEVV